MLHVVYLINRVPTKILNNKSSYEVLYGEVPDLSNLKVFGCLSYESTLPVNRHKFNSRDKKCAFLGYKSGIKGFVLVDVHTSEIVVFRNVKFFDLEFPFHSSSVTTVPSTHIYLDNQVTNIVPVSDIIVNSSEDHDEVPHEDSLTDTEERDIKVVLVATRKSSRSSQAPTYLQDYVCNSTSGHYPMTNFISYSALSPKHLAYAYFLNNEIEPTSYLSASKDSRWLTAMQTEIEALNTNNTWEFVDLPSDVVSIGSKWVYKIKRHAYVTIERFKAHLVAQGFNQTEGLGYFETFSPLAKLSTIRVLLALASIHGWHLHQLDVNNAFLHGHLHEAVYMRVPQIPLWS